jgi:hypothetical protein
MPNLPSACRVVYHRRISTSGPKIFRRNCSFGHSTRFRRGLFPSCRGILDHTQRPWNPLKPISLVFFALCSLISAQESRFSGPSDAKPPVPSESTTARRIPSSARRRVPRVAHGPEHDARRLPTRDLAPLASPWLSRAQFEPDPCEGSSRSAPSPVGAGRLHLLVKRRGPASGQVLWLRLWLGIECVLGTSG